MDYLHFFIEAAISLLGGIATAIAILKLFGDKLADFWFKKAYRQWEIVLEKKYKEDFARFERKLDAVAAKDETKFNHLHPERAKAAREIYLACEKLVNSFDFFITSVLIAEAPATAEYLAEHQKNKAAVMDSLTNAYALYTDSSLYFGESTHKLYTAVVHTIARYTQLPSSREGLRLYEIENQCRDNLKALQNHFKELLGVTEN